MTSRSLKAQGKGIAHPEFTRSLLRNSWSVSARYLEHAYASFSNSATQPNSVGLNL